MRPSVVTPPSKLCIYNLDLMSATYEFFKRINDVAVIDEQLVIVDLRLVDNITAAAALVLFATTNFSGSAGRQTTLARR